MERRSLSAGWPAIACSLALLSLAAFGCKSMLQSFTLLYQGYDQPAEWDGLKGKKVAVVCKPLTSLEYSSAGVDRLLAEGICEELKAHIKDIHIIDQRKVADLRDEKPMEDFVQIGKALKAEKVVGIDIESFGIRDGATLFKGRATVHIQVFDVADGSCEWHKNPEGYLYPRIGSTSIQDQPEAEFRNAFVAILATEIARYFFPHDPRDAFGSDAMSVR
jgi:hypothetical protein